jgi:hypothetical protein
LAVLGHEGIKIYQACDPLGQTIGDAGDHHPAGAVSDQDHTPQVLALQNLNDVLDMGLEADLGTSEVGAFAEPGERRLIDIVTPRA